MTDLEIRSVPESDGEAAHELRRIAFGGSTEWDPDAPPLDPDLHVGAYEGERLVGTVVTHCFEQWFGGRAIPCGGVAGVTVEPGLRGRGAARSMMRESFDRMAGRGQVISSLFPTTVPLYRSVGYEVAGWWAQRAIPLAALPESEPSVKWERADYADPVFPEAYAALASGRDGWVVPDDAWWERRAHGARTMKPSYWHWVGRRDGEAVATVTYRTKESDRSLYDLELEAVPGAVGPDGLRALLGFLAANGTTVDRIHTSLPMPVLETVLDRPETIPVERDWPWMLRLLDLPGAVAARGYPSVVDATVHLEVTDPVVPANEGRWVLEVSGGKGALTSGGEGTVAISVSDLARLYSGGTDPSALVAAGRLSADGDTQDALRAVFAGNPSNPIFF